MNARSGGIPEHFQVQENHLNPIVRSAIVIDVFVVVTGVVAGLGGNRVTK